MRNCAQAWLRGVVQVATLAKSWAVARMVVQGVLVVVVMVVMVVFLCSSCGGGGGGGGQVRHHGKTLKIHVKELLDLVAVLLPARSGHTMGGEHGVVMCIIGSGRGENASVARCVPLSLPNLIGLPA